MKDSALLPWVLTFVRMTEVERVAYAYAALSPGR